MLAAEKQEKDKIQSTLLQIIEKLKLNGNGSKLQQAATNMPMGVEKATVPRTTVTSRKLSMQYETM
jgi:IMP cyclohydrolase